MEIVRHPEAATYDLSLIDAPTLIVHARDDAINPFAIGEFIAAGLPSASIFVVDEGGHLLLGLQSDVHDRVNEFLKANESR